MQPLLRIASLIDRLNEGAGRIFSWAVLLLLVAQFIIVLLHYVFRVGSIFAQESLLYLNSLLFLGTAGYALLHNAHVRVDIFYAGKDERAKARVNLIGTVIFLLPVMTLIWVFGIPYVLSSWRTLEGSIETGGIQAVYVLKSLILLFAAALTLQGVSTIIRSIALLRGDITAPPEEPKEAL